MSVQTGWMMMQRMTWIMGVSEEIVNGSAWMMSFSFSVVSCISVIMVIMFSSFSMRWIMMMSVVGC